LQRRSAQRRSDSGQAIVIVAVGLTVLVFLAGVVIDGGNAWAQQRVTQNGTDASALAGATVMVENLGGSPKTDTDVSTAVAAAAANNGVSLGVVNYVDWSNAVIGTVGQGGAIPGGAAGVRANGSKTFPTYFAGFAGLDSLTAGAAATAVAGTLRGICAALDGCPAAPLAFSINVSDCLGNGNIQIGTNPWPLVDLATAKADQGIGNFEAIVPGCKVGPGGVGWIDMGCGGNLKQEVANPCNQALSIPTWLQTNPGNPNSVDSAMNSHDGQIILLPLFDGTCRSIPSSGLLGDCTDPGNGNNLYYHIPWFAGFLLDHAYIQGDNSVPCNSAPGITVTPPSGGNGGTSCIKGWFVRYITQGPVGAFNPNTDQGAALGVQLIR
jgi:hypothetical protein